MKTKINSKRYFSIILCMLCYIGICNAQMITSSIDTGIFKQPYSCLYVVKVKNSTDILTMYLLLEPKFIGGIYIPTKDEFKKNYGDIKADAIMIVTPKEGVKLLNISQIFDKYKIDMEYRKYPVIIDRIETVNSKTLLANEGIIDKVIVNKGKKYIEIITIEYKSSMESLKRAFDKQNANKK